MDTTNTFSIYQVKDGEETRDLRFRSLAELHKAGLAVDIDNYELAYTETRSEGLGTAAALESLFDTFNRKHPADFYGHSLSVGDVVVLRSDGQTAAYYCDRFGFQPVPEFSEGVYLYYTERPVDIGTFPKSEGQPVEIEAFDARRYMEDGTVLAWGVVTYTAPLTQKQIADFELKPAADNPDQMRLAPKQLAARLQVIGQFETARRLISQQRITEFDDTTGAFVKKKFFTHAMVTARYRKAELSFARAEKRLARKIPIAEQLQAGAEQAAKDNAALPAREGKDRKKDRS